MKQNYFYINVYQPKTTEDIGTLWRSAHNFGADFIFTIGARYHKQLSDTTKAISEKDITTSGQTGETSGPCAGLMLACVR
jgi:basic membrane lipoprotein Med (substrate-binding protein (PBP1-ABC) superfamily)